jgi:hypothetical protein
MRVGIITGLLMLLPLGCAPQLDAEHPGWKQPNCRTSGCHERPHTDKAPYQCAECHDSNGAPASHRPDSANACGPCHGEMHGGPAATFIDPKSCNACHR